jgi:hypothetical protein
LAEQTHLGLMSVFNVRLAADGATVRAMLDP